MDTKSLRQEAVFKAGPHVIYEMLLDSDKHSQFTGAKAEISREVGGSVSAYDGIIQAVNEELHHNARIVQTWRSSDWPEGHFSTVTFEIFPTDEGCGLILTQTGIPADKYEMIAEGWQEQYWDKMRKMIEE
ncbi:MAG: SRPBCC domain-containing protein [Patescibacteria group bacterium]|nr:SRPBCC domain-containing protein [Patescibacteria group bacterium]